LYPKEVPWVLLHGYAQNKYSGFSLHSVFYMLYSVFRIQNSEYFILYSLACKSRLTLFQYSIHMNQLVRTSLLILSFLMGLVAIVPAQTVDVTKVLADPKTYTFSDNKHTVKTYIYETLEAQTTCCGPARMYLEVKIDPSGYVLNVKPLTGQTQECYAKSVQDIVKNIKWNAQGYTAAKSIYFEIKPSIECGEGRNNSYAQVKIFNNEKVDINGVPLNYASSTGVSASAAAGTSGTPDVPAGAAPAATEPAKEAVAANTAPAGNDNAGETENAGTSSGLPTPPGKTKETPVETASGGDVTGVPDKTRSSSNAQMATALEMARKDKEAQDAEIQRLKDELAASKAAEEQRKKEEAEAAERAAEEAEQARLAEQRAKEEERQRLKEERERERKRLADERNRDRRDDRRDGGFRDVDYSDDGRGNRGRDRYADNRDEQEPPRQMTEVERRQKEADDLRREMDDLKRRMREADNSERESQRNRERLANDLIRLEERRLKADAAVAEAREKEELDRLNQSIREADERKREKDRLVQEKMREMERMKSDLERAVADLERFEQEAAQKETEKAAKEAEIASAQEKRNAEIEAELARMRLESGNAGPNDVAEGVDKPFTGDADVTRQLEILRQQILILTQQINDLRNGGGGFSGAGIASNGGTRGAGATSNRRGRPAAKSEFKSAAANRDWERLKTIDDILDPNRKEEYPSEVFNTVSEPAPGQEKAAANSPGNPEHMNIAGPKFTKPDYAGGVTAMKQFVADELKKNSVCGLAHTAFEVTIDGSGKVLAHNILAVNNQNLLLYLPAIVNRLQFQATGSGLPVRAVYELKADIACEGVEKVDLNSVPNLIRN
jgi:hypothetical protein